MSVLTTGKSGIVWAWPQRLAGRKFKVGATAFLTPEAADMRRLGLCAKNMQRDKVKVLERFAPVVLALSAKAQPPMIYQGQVK